MQSITSRVEEPYDQFPAPTNIVGCRDFTDRYLLGSWVYIADKRLYVFAPLAIGCFVCLLGYSIASLRAPAWLVVAGPLPLDILLLWYVLRKPRKMLVAYGAIWAIYILIHILMSAIVRYDSLIPAWRLHS